MSHVEIMEFPYGQFLEVRLEFVLLRDNELQAKIMRIIEGWMIDQKKEWLKACAQAASDSKPEPPEPEYFVTLSYAQIIAQLYMFNSSRKGQGKEVIEGKENSIHRNTITKAMSALIEDNYVITRPNPNRTKEFDATQYSLNLPLVQEHMRLLPKNPISYLGSNGRIDGVECPDFFDPPTEIPCTKFVHGGDAQKSYMGGCTKNGQPMHEKSASPSTKNVHGDAQKNSHLIDRIIDPEKKEGKNEGAATHSSIPSQSFTSSEPTQEEITLTEDEQRIYDVACSEMFKAKPPEITPKLKEECADLAKHITTIEQFQSLLAFVRALPYIKGKIHLKNLVNELNGWLQTQYKPTAIAGPPKQSSQIEQLKAIQARILAQAAGVN